MSKKIDRTGEVGVNNDGEKMVIVRYGNSKDIDVEFVNDGTVIKNRRYGDFKRGEIKNPMTPNVYGVGYFGIGKFKSCDENGKLTKCYRTWFDMLKRCYDPKYQDKYPTYKGCKVCPEWHNFQVFAEWYYSNFYEIENEPMALDKDILHKGNKLYSPDNCIFVPQFINNLFVKNNTSRGNCYIGVNKYEDKFVAHVNKGNSKLIHLGYYTTPELAFLAYKEAKESYIKEVAEKYKQKIPHEAYEALMNYEVEIDD